MITATDAAWAAGFIDGEGHFRLGFTANSSSPFTTVLQVSQIVPEPLLLLQEWFGGAVNHSPSRPIYVYSAQGSNLDRLLASVTPYLRVKQRQAETMAEMRTALRSHPRGKSLSWEQIDRRIRLITKMNDLNRRVPDVR